MNKKRFIIAIDGIAASGKGTIGIQLSKILKFHYLDTGLLYRSVAFLTLQEGNGIISEKIASLVSKNFVNKGSFDKRLFGNEIAEAASIIASFKSVRENLYQYQKKFPDNHFGSIIDGRDIGTIVFPDAEVKLFITANTNVRVQRRLIQLKKGKNSLSFRKLKSDLINRDNRDYTREISPLRCDKDAFLIDTSFLTIDESVKLAKKIIENKLQIL